MYFTSIVVSSFHFGCKMPMLSNIRENLNLFSALSIISGKVPRIRVWKKRKLTKFAEIWPMARNRHKSSRTHAHKQARGRSLPSRVTNNVAPTFSRSRYLPVVCVVPWQCCLVAALPYRGWYLLGPLAHRCPLQPSGIKQEQNIGTRNSCLGLLWTFMCIPTE